MINTCIGCGAVREYPDGKAIYTCPRCGGTMRQRPSPKTKEEREKLIIDAIKGRIGRLKTAGEQ